MSGRKKQKKPRGTKETAPSTTADPGTRLPPHAPEFRANRAVLVSRETLVSAGARSCFDVAIGRLEQPLTQDPVVLEASPPGNGVRRTGGTSYLTISAAGKTLRSTAIVTVHRPDRVLSWVLSEYPKYKEYWRFEPDPLGTLVQLHLGYEVSGSILNRFWQELIGKRRLEEQAHRLLDTVKGAAEAGGSF